MKIKTHIGFSEKGQRANNEDYVLSNSGRNTSEYDITIVCDGVGGAQKGEVASQLVCSELLGFLEKQSIVNDTILREAVEFVEAKLNAYVESQPYSDGMATTLTVAVEKDTIVQVMHVGDSKILCLQNKTLAYASHDHSLVNEMVETGLISEQEALTHPKRNVITRALAAGGTKAEPSLKSLEGWQPGDAIFLCTDGVLESFTPEELADLINSDLDDQTIVNQIKTKCLANSKDNYSGYLLRF
jgi:protein phosphatase